MSARPRQPFSPPLPFLMPPTLSRRGLLRYGAGGAAAAYATHFQVLESDAVAAILQPALRRASWLALEDPSLTLVAGGVAHTARITAVADLPIASRIPALQGHDAAFVVRLRCDAAIASGIATVHGGGLGPVDLFVSPVDGAPGVLEIVVDRTVKIAGVNEEGEPQVAAVAAARAVAPQATPAAPPRRPELRNASVRRARTGGRRSSVALALDGTADVVAVRVSLLTPRGKLVARGFGAVRRPTRLRLRLQHRGRLSATSQRLVVRLTLRDGSNVVLRTRVTPR